MRQGLWGIVSGRVVKPSIMDAKAPTSTELENCWNDSVDSLDWIMGVLPYMVLHYLPILGNLLESHYHL